MTRLPKTVRRISTCLLVAASVLAFCWLVPGESLAAESDYYELGCTVNWMLGGCACAELPYWPNRCKEQYYGCAYPAFPDNERSLCEMWCNGQYPDAEDQFCIATPSDILPGRQCWSCVGVTVPDPPLPGGGGGGPDPEEENQDVPDGGGGPVGGGCYMTRVCTYFPDGSVECGPDQYYCD